MGATITISYDAVLMLLSAIIIAGITFIISYHIRNSEKLDKINDKMGKFNNDLALLKQDNEHLKEKMNELQPKIESSIKDKLNELKNLKADMNKTKLGGSSILGPE